MGVYFPYMIVDVNSHANFSGEGEEEIRRYTVGTDNNRRTYYDANLYAVERDFDLTIEGLTIESNLERLDNASSNQTNNIINSIMPFDIENCVKWDSNYLKGYSSEKRDVDISQLDYLMQEQAKDIARYAANDTLKKYDRGVCWHNEQLEIKGRQWKAAYLPVWLYSYQQVKNKKKLLHYVAVNARTKETMGSVPIHIPKLFITSVILEICGGFATFPLFSVEDAEALGLLGWLTGFVFFGIMYARYRNSGARHKHELETKKKMFNLIERDQFIRRKDRLSNSYMVGANNTRVGGKSSLRMLRKKK